MTSAAKILLPLLLLAGTAGGAFWLLNQEAPVPTPVDHETPKPPPAVAPEVKPVVSTTAPPTNVRETVDTSAAAANASSPQGVRGRVLLPEGAPAANIPVFLLENGMNDPITLFLNNKRGLRAPPLAQAVTDSDGVFALGVAKAGTTCDVRVVSDRHPEKNHRSIKVRPEEWVDVKDLVLEVGLLVQGRVVQEGNEAAIPGAKVYLSESNSAHTMVATPGRERGIMVETDGSGFFRFTNAPRQGLVNLGAEAPQYAWTELQNLQLTPDGQNEFTLQLAAGQPIAGVVVDSNGKPLHAKITATAMSAKTPQTANAETDDQGHFDLAALREGPYQLLVSANGYEEQPVKPVLAGNTEVKVVLEQRAFAKIKVLTATGAPVKSYRVSLKRHFPNNPLGIGNVPEFTEKGITPGDYPSEFGGEWAVVRGLPNGDFAFQVMEKNHAKTLSPPFSVQPGQIPEVVVTLTLGGVIEGQVVDDHGNPVKGAAVATDMSGAFQLDGSGFLEIFKPFMPEKHTVTKTTTDEAGRFRLTKLAFADYMVRVSHPDFCEEGKQEIKLETEGQRVDVGVIRLSRGAVVEGTTTLAGQLAGQIKVTIGPTEQDMQQSQTEIQQQQQQNPGTPARPRSFFSAMVISDSEGRYRLLKRVPPGTYKMHAQRSAGTDGPFGALLDMKQTERQITIMPGQDKLVQNFDVPKQ